MKKWLFSIVMFIFAITIFAYGMVVLFLEEYELFFQGGVLASYGTFAIIVLLIGFANKPKKGEEE